MERHGRRSTFACQALVIKALDPAREKSLMLDNFREDWRTYEGDIFCPGLWVMAVYRFGRWRYRIGFAPIRKPFSLAYKILFAMVRAVTGTELPCEAKVGRRLRIDHSHGIVISGDARLGDDVILRNGVTIGLRRAGVRGSPIIGDRADIGAGAKILGTIRLGNDVCVGANAVVLTDVPANSVAVGIPAHIITRSAKPALQLEWQLAEETFS
jgi:serine O-acetyltransferase